jgi:hypothetical protein
MRTVVHSVGAITDLLRRGLTPITDNEEALIALGFTRAYPQIRTGYDSMIWERTVDSASSCRPRALVRERAFLEGNYG